ncbi:hypothetical protein ER308_08735 [Egibacter rhizosphaerae]|uniref:Uncharacterized protein n=1 Tax=Egibacter rhizosphaerae TaxID=1670831 RepID=A0A411YEJ4_9ACTN|nr:hypothetical protein ER308_08735 [Egibacter rhizosphaerae]
MRVDQAELTSLPPQCHAHVAVGNVERGGALLAHPVRQRGGPAVAARDIGQLPGKRDQIVHSRRRSP